MTLPIRTTTDDIEKICGYLNTKPTGATAAEAKAVLDKKVLDGRKLSALKLWGLIEDNGDRMKLTELGRLVARDQGARKAEALRAVVANIEPYRAQVERAVHRSEASVTATDVAAHLHEHFREESSDSERTLNDQAVCFFQLAQGADLGQLIIGRRGQPTRFEFDAGNARSFVEGSATEPSTAQTSALFDRRNEATENEGEDADDKSGRAGGVAGATEIKTPTKAPEKGNRVFITHGKNKKILEQVKQLVEFGKFDPVVAQENETVAKSVPAKVMDDMRSCQAAVIHVGADGSLLDPDGNQVPQINGNVLIEIGAAMALYGRNFILLVEEGVNLPSNLQGLYECRYSGDELNMPATMKLLKAFNDFN